LKEHACSKRDDKNIPQTNEEGHVGFLYVEVRGREINSSPPISELFEMNVSQTPFKLLCLLNSRSRFCVRNFTHVDVFLFLFKLVVV